MMPFEYPCPDCGRTNNIHESGCEYEDTDIQQIRKAYIDVLSVLLAENADRYARGANPGISYDTLTDKVSANLQSQDQPGLWRSIHRDCLHALKDDHRVAEDDAKGGLYVMEPTERDHDIIPQYDPLKTVYEVGPIDGCKDNAVFAMVSWCEMIEFDWDQKVNFMTDWLTETGRWESETWAESSPEQLLANKKHIHEKGMGWKNRAEAAKGVIDNSDADPQIDAHTKADTASTGDYE